MTSCCRGRPCAEIFTPRFARRSARRYRSKGLDRVERYMLAHAAREGVEGARVLEIGGGVGRLQTELVKAGASSGEIVELVPAYEQYARELARDAGIEGRTTFRVADILEDPVGVEPADVVLLNRVVCCSPDGIELAAEAARHTQRALILSYPRDLLPIRAAVRLQNLTFRLL
ncbi:MAG TPA: class I SAM-dependent methyltransferase, partial [Gaiellaceae bacterium]|nr:class I SAM-dependent methyltransferase [Gaiellaceae bacterium]